MDLPRKTDPDSVAYWTMIDQAAERVKQIAERQAMASTGSEPLSQTDRDAPEQGD